MICKEIKKTTKQYGPKHTSLSLSIRFNGSKFLSEYKVQLYYVAFTQQINTKSPNPEEIYSTGSTMLQLVIYILQYSLSSIIPLFV